MYQSKPKIWSLQYTSAKPPWLCTPRRASVPATKVGGEPINSAFIFNYSFYRGTFMLTTPELMDPWRINLCQISSIERQLGHFCGKSKKISLQEKQSCHLVLLSNWQYMNFPKLYSVCINSKLQGSANSAGNQKRPFWGAPPFCILFHTCTYVCMLIMGELFFSNHKEGRCWFVHIPTTTP